MTEPPPIDPAHFAGVVASASDEQLRAGLAANRELLLLGIFGSMGAQFDAAAAGGARAVLEWRIGERADGGEDVYQVTVADGACVAAPGEGAAPDAVFRIGALDFLKLVTSNVSGPELFVFGRLVLEGDLVLAARSQTWFRIPGAASL
jgi:hypothetical protein